MFLFEALNRRKESYKERRWVAYMGKFTSSTEISGCFIITKKEGRLLAEMSIPTMEAEIGRSVRIVTFNEEN